MKQQLSDNSASEPVCGAGSCDSEELTNLGQRECRCFGLVVSLSLVHHSVHGSRTPDHRAGYRSGPVAGNLCRWQLLAFVKFLHIGPNSANSCSEAARAISPSCHTFTHSLPKSF
jgi:hypothetical protein